jgi:hypothetical protein
MALRRLGSAALLCAAVLAVGAAGCGREHKEPAREGLAVRVGGLDYNVFITRELNLRDPEDHDYYRGPEAPPGSSLYGVFVQVCNPAENGSAKPAAENFKIVDTQGEEFRPLAMPPDNIFAYRARDLSAQACIPEEGSAASSSPTAGALLIFKLTNQATENRPLELEIEGPPGTTGRTIELDI